MAQGWRISPHAKQRMAERGFDRRDVLTAVIHPEVIYPGPPEYPPGRRVAKRGKIAVVFCAATKVIVTVLLAGIDYQPSESNTVSQSPRSSR